MLQGSFRLCNWMSLRRLVSWINHLPPAYWSTFWKSMLNTSWAVGLTYWIAYLHFFSILTYAIIYVLIHHIFFWLYLYFILYFCKYSCTNIFHRRSFCTFYQLHRPRFINHADLKCSSTMAIDSDTAIMNFSFCKMLGFRDSVMKTAIPSIMLCSRVSVKYVMRCLICAFCRYSKLWNVCFNRYMALKCVRILSFSVTEGPFKFQIDRIIVKIHFGAALSYDKMSYLTPDMQHQIDMYSVLFA